MKEHALKFGTNGSLIGILTEDDPIDSSSNANKGLVALLFNAGLIHHVGPNRIYVKLARRLAGMDIRTLRFDFSGIGDSGPRTDKLPANDSMLDDARQAMDELERNWGAKAFICIGLCAGAAAAAQVGLADDRVKKLIMINPMLPVSPQANLLHHSNYYYTSALFNPRSWFKLISLRSNYLSILKVIHMKIKVKFRPHSMREDEQSEVLASLRHFFHHMKVEGKQLLMLFSEDDIGEQYLQAIVGNEYNILKQSGQMKTKKLVGADHLVAPLSCQQDLIESVTDWLNESV